VAHGDGDIESQRSWIVDDSVMFPPTLPGEEKVNELLIDAADVFARVVRDLGITSPQSVQEPAARGIFMPAGRSHSPPTDQVLTLPVLLSPWAFTGLRFGRLLNR
jgi:hypothetical protein